MEYRVHLNKFDGPLDLLLHLIEKAELDIKDIFLSEITAEFLEYLTIEILSTRCLIKYINYRKMD